VAVTHIGEISITVRTLTTLTVDTTVSNDNGTIVEEITFTKSVALTNAFLTDVEVAAGSPVVLDLHSGENDIEGSGITDDTVGLIAVFNRSTTPGDYITVGSGSSPITTCWGASGDAAVVGPYSPFILSSLLDGFGLTNATADNLTLTAAAATTSEARVLVWWI
jgi:hypothetical protein